MGTVTINGGAEITSGLSDIPVFIASIMMLAAAYRYRQENSVGKAWFDAGLLLPLTVALGAILHIFRIDERYLRFLWPLTYFLITLITGLFWILILEIFSPYGADRRTRVLILGAVAAVSMVNAVQRFFLGKDLTPLFTVFAIPVVIHCAWTVYRYRHRTGREVIVRTAVAVLLLLMSVIVEAAMRRPAVLFGIKFGGAFFSHMLIIAAMMVLVSLIRLTSEGKMSHE